jgi:cytochrome c553
MKKSLVLRALLLAGGSTLASDVEFGRAKADSSCALCHGRNGVATMPGAPNLAGQQQIYVAEQLKLYRSGKRHNEVMNVIAKTLTDQEIEGLSLWYASIPVKVE